MHLNKQFEFQNQGLPIKHFLPMISEKFLFTNIHIQIVYVDIEVLLCQIYTLPMNEIPYIKTNSIIFIEIY